MSDWDAQHGGVASTLAGLDMTMPGESSNFQIRSGLLLT